MRRDLSGSQLSNSVFNAVNSSEEYLLISSTDIEYMVMKFQITLKDLDFVQAFPY